MKRNINFLLLISCAVPLVMGIAVANYIYPAYNKREQTGKILIATFTPLIFVILKVICRFPVQRLGRISHPGRTLICIPRTGVFWVSCNDEAFASRSRSCKISRLYWNYSWTCGGYGAKYCSLIDYLYHYITYNSWRQLPGSDFALHVVHVNEYFYTDNKTRLQILQSIETHYQNRSVFAVWRKQWKRHLIVAIINALIIAVWSSTSLLIAIQSQFDGIKNYCEMPFSHI